MSHVGRRSAVSMTMTSVLVSGKLFWYQVHYDMHTRTHTHLYYYSSITKNCLKRHVIQKHSNILLKCPTEGCEYTTPDKYKLQVHLKMHRELVSCTAGCIFTPMRDVYLSLIHILS
ncbi:UNVERIFIED_CONTAM: hypothetical protein FKN15_070336 [Acipenser sinensis]